MKDKIEQELKKRKEHERKEFLSKKKKEMNKNFKNVNKKRKDAVAKEIEGIFSLIGSFR